MEINYAALEELIVANERAPGFDLSQWETRLPECGTVGCLYGNYALAIRNMRPHYYCSFRRATTEFGVSLYETYFLFAAWNVSWKAGYGLKDGNVRDNLDRTAAINRVRKFLHYKKRKAAIFADLDRARHQEGNWMVSRHVAEQLAASGERVVAV